MKKTFIIRVTGMYITPQLLSGSNIRPFQIADTIESDNAVDAFLRMEKQVQTNFGPNAVIYDSNIRFVANERSIAPPESRIDS